ncbi:response regulator transcription factor [Rhizobium tumorigenes]|uniref:Response regulator n=1 Tax=Rhizobium tumorigenes TaxID=2041385 RepID=A0AAF1KMH1_9HYPH|nr:response regulator [Rhizobium tumorigenes]WFR97908.1 response regulator [Rhizobium tumorigenes]
MASAQLKAPQSADPAASVSDTVKLSVLVVEDEPLIRLATVDMLEELGHSVSEVGTAEEALVMLDKNQPDIVLTDLGLPGMDGKTFCHEIRGRWPTVAIIFATGMDEGPALGDPSHTALLRKPFGIGELKMALAAAVDA